MNIILWLIAMFWAFFSGIITYRYFSLVLKKKNYVYILNDHKFECLPIIRANGNKYIQLIKNNKNQIYKVNFKTYTAEQVFGQFLFTSITGNKLEIFKLD